MKTLTLAIFLLALTSGAAFAGQRGSISTDLIYGGGLAHLQEAPYQAPGPHRVDRGEIDTSMLYGGPAALTRPNAWQAPGPHVVDRQQIDTDLLYGGMS